MIDPLVPADAGAGAPQPVASILIPAIPPTTEVVTPGTDPLKYITPPLPPPPAPKQRLLIRSSSSLPPLPPFAWIVSPPEYPVDTFMIMLPPAPPPEAPS